MWRILFPGLLLATLGFLTVQDAGIPITRKLAGKADLTFKITGAEFYTIADHPELSIEIQTETTNTFAAEPKGADIEIQSIAIAKDSFVILLGKEEQLRNDSSGTTAKLDGNPVVLRGLDAVIADDPKTIPPIVVAVPPAANLLAGTVQGILEDDMKKVGMPGTAHFLAAKNLNVAERLDKKIELFFPPVPKTPVKVGDRWNSWQVAGTIGAKKIRVDFVSVVESATAEKIVIQQSGKPAFAKADDPAASSEGIEYTLDAEKSYFSSKVVISPKDGIIETREGELMVVFSAKKEGDKAEAKTATAKIWSKLERVKK